MVAVAELDVDAGVGGDRGWVVATGVALTGVAALAAAVTGYLLPWDQLALYRVTVGGNIRGYHEILFTKHVKYVLVGNVEVGASAFARSFWIHTVVVTVLLIALLGVLALHARRQPGRA